MSRVVEEATQEAVAGMIQSIARERAKHKVEKITNGRSDNDPVANDPKTSYSEKFKYLDESLERLKAEYEAEYPDLFED